MTTVTICKTNSGEYTGFYTFGHAEFADKGKDIVCAAVSVLVINTLNSLEQITKEPYDLTQNEENGMISCRFKSSISDSSKILMDSLVLGLNGIQAEYGKKYFKLKFEEV